MPRPVKISLALFALAILGFVVILIHGPNLPSLDDEPPVIVSSKIVTGSLADLEAPMSDGFKSLLFWTVVPYVVYLLSAILAYCRIGWARWLLVLTLATMFLPLPGLGLPGIYSAGVIAMLSLTLMFVAAGLLFAPSANAWFGKQA